MTDRKEIKLYPMDKIDRSRYQVRRAYNSIYLQTLTELFSKNLSLEEIREQLYTIHPEIKDNTDEQKHYEELIGLTQSIKTSGLISPIAIQHVDNKYELIAGERRFQACKILQKKEIEGISFSTLSNYEKFLIAGAENLQQGDLLSIEREELIYKLYINGLSTGDIKTHADLGRKIGLSSSLISHILEAREFRQKSSVSDTISTKILVETAPLPERARELFIKRVNAKEIKTDEISSYVKTYNEVSAPIKLAMQKKQSTITPDMAIEINALPDEERKDEIIKEIETHTDKDDLATKKRIITTAKDHQKLKGTIISIESKKDEANRLSSQILTNLETIPDIKQESTYHTLTHESFSDEEKQAYINATKEHPATTPEILIKNVKKDKDKQFSTTLLSQIGELKERDQKILYEKTINKVARNELTEDDVQTIIKDIRTEPKSVDTAIDKHIKLKQREKRASIEKRKRDEGARVRERAKHKQNASNLRTLAAMEGFFCPYCGKSAIDHLHDDGTLVCWIKNLSNPLLDALKQQEANVKKAMKSDYIPHSIFDDYDEEE